MINIFKNKISIISAIVFLLVFTFPLLSYAAAWQGPTANPPQNNLAEPLNKSDYYQMKTGTMHLGGNYYATTPCGSAFCVETGGMIIKAGNVGIGTTAPGAPLQVYSVTNNATALISPYSAVRAGSVLVGSLAGTASYAGLLGYPDGAGFAFIGNYNPIHAIANGDVDEYGALYHTGRNGQQLLAGNGNFDFQVATAGSGNRTMNSRMIITSAGNVGIGTTNPGVKLQVGTTVASAFPTLGTASGHTALIGNGGAWGMYLGLDDSGRGWIQQMRNDGATAYDLSLQPRGGNVGIGSTMPSYRLVVSGGTGIVQDVSGGRITGVGNAVLNADALSLGYANGLYAPISSALPSGTTGQTLRHNGTSWVSNSVLYNNGTNIGIGTTNPRSLLQIDSSTSDPLKLRIHTESGTVDSLAGLAFGVDTANQYMKSAITHQRKGSNGQGDLVFLVDTNTDGANVAIGDEKMRIQGGTGNVGIGTAAPGTKLDIKTPDENNGGAIDQNILRIWNPYHSSSSGVGARLLFQLDDDSSNKRAEIAVLSDNAGYGDQANLVFSTGNNGSIPRYGEVMRITGTGNVGIGTAAPNAKLDLGTGYGASGEKFLIYNDNSTSALAGTKTGFYLDRFGLSNNVSFVFPTAAANPGSYILVSKDTGGTTLVPRVTVLGESGNVGIGETAPSHTLTVSGLANNSIFWGERVRNISTAGVAPYTSGAGIMFSLNEYPAVAKMSGVAMVSESQWGNSVGLRFYTGNDLTTSKMAITSAGKVGIGTTNPGANLQVAGSVAATGYSEPNYLGLLISGDGVNGLVYARNGSNNWAPMYIDGTNVYINAQSTGYVGIGTNLPSEKLHVVGNAKISGTLQLGGADVAEEFIADKHYSAGTVLIMGDDGYKSAKACFGEYDNRVLGVVSDNASLIMGKVETDKKAIVALTGVVKVKANNSNGEIKKGDLLTTSGVHGEAMKAKEFKIGTIIGKALEDLNSESGEIMALVNLQ